MSWVTKIIQGLFLVIMIGAWSTSAPNPAGQTRDALSPKDSTDISTRATQPVSIAELLAKTQYVKSPSYSKSEPLLLLLSGIAMLVAATTVKKAASKWSMGKWSVGRWAAGRKRSS
jgi:hypothetical protein